MHIPGWLNNGTDAISRDNPILFHFQVPAAQPSPTPLPPAAVGPADPTTARLDISQLVPVVRDLFTAGLADSTHKAYQAGSKRYSTFCQEANLTPYPALEEVLVLFIAHLYQQKIAHGTIKSSLAAIRYKHIQHGTGNLETHPVPQLEYILKGVKKATPASRGGASQ